MKRILPLISIIGILLCSCGNSVPTEDINPSTPEEPLDPADPEDPADPIKPEEPEEPKYYMVTWLNYDESFLDETKVQEGMMPVYDAAVPSKEESEEYVYEFTGWSPSLAPASEDTTYVATFKEVKKQEFTVTWLNYDNEVLDIEKYIIGNLPSYKGGEPVRPKDNDYEYTFSGWTPEISNVYEDTTYTATFSRMERPMIMLIAPSEEEVGVIAKDIYDDFKNSEEGGHIFFNEMYRALIQETYKNSSSKLWNSKWKLTSYQTLIEHSNSQIDFLKQQALELAGQYSTSFEYEFDKILKAYDVESEEQLFDKLLYEYEAESIRDAFIKEHLDDIVSKYINEFKAHPYVTRHILAKIGSEIPDSKIASFEASKLWEIVRVLMDTNYSFEEIAQSYSDDASSFGYGDVGIMDSRTNFYNEYKLALYVYDLLYKNKNNTKANQVAINLRLNEEVKTEIDKTKLGYVPYEIFYKLALYAHSETADSGKPQMDGDERYFPRNIYFNKYLNRRNAFLITNDKAADEENSELSVYLDKDGSDYSNTSYIEPSFIENNRFKYVEGLSRDANHKILVDGHDNPIVGVRSMAGIHFIVIEKSACDSNLEQYYSLTNVTADTYFGRYLNGDSPEALLHEAQFLIQISYYYVDYERDIFNELLEINDDYSFYCRDTSFDSTKYINDYFDKMKKNSSMELENNLSSSWIEYIHALSAQRASRQSEDFLTEDLVYKFLNGELVDN